MKLLKNNTVHVLFITVLLVFASACKINRLEHRVNENIPAPKLAEDALFLLLQDDTKVYGEKLKIVPPTYVKLDGKRYERRELKAFEAEGYWYIVDKSYYLKRLIHGKANFYVSINTNAFSAYFIQLGDDGEIILLTEPKNIAAVLHDCPKVFELLNISNSEFQRKYQENNNYITDAINYYNTKCN